MTWLDGRMLAFDTETSGVDTSTDRIVTACLAYVGGGQPTEVHEWLIDPGIEIPEGAAVLRDRARAELREANR